MYFRTPCHGYALNCLFVYLAIPGIRPLFKTNMFLKGYPSEAKTKQKLFILFTCNLEKVKFTVQINMKQVS